MRDALGPRRSAHHRHSGAAQAGVIEPVRSGRSTLSADLRDAERLRRLLRTVGLGGDSWKWILAGQSAAAVGAALKLFAAGGLSRRATEHELVISALICCTRRGDPAAELVLRHIVRRLRIARLRPATRVEQST